jgi:hypothetical protein
MLTIPRTPHDLQVVLCVVELAPHLLVLGLLVKYLQLFVLTKELKPSPFPLGNTRSGQRQSLHPHHAHPVLANVHDPLSSSSNSRAALALRRDTLASGSY